MKPVPRTRKRLFSRDDYLAPPAVPRPSPRAMCLNTILAQERGWFID